MIISIKDCWKHARSRHHLYFDDVVAKRRKRLKGDIPTAVVRFLEVNHDAIRDGDEGDFRQIQRKYNRLLGSFTAKQRLQIDKNIKKIFNYSSFIVKETTGKWCAYTLCTAVGAATCPYCNLAYGHTLIIKGNGRIRPELDHFFDKASYPLFAISLNNLMPSCHFCNSSLKLTGNFFEKAHLNPLLDDEAIEVVLDVNPFDARNNIKLFDTAKIELRYDKNNPKIVNSVDTFHLLERYQFLVDEARQIARYLTVYRTSQGPIKGNLEWARRGVDSTNYKNRVLGKLILDLADLYS